MKRLVPVAVLLGLLLYAWQATGPWKRAALSGSGRDFASYYYAVQVAADGEDPYDHRALSREARQDRTRSSVHPFFYPPPAAGAFAWVLPMDLHQAVRAWYAAQHLFLLAVLLSLWRWWPHRGIAALLALVAVTFSPIPDNDRMGQANLLVLALVAPGALAAERGRERLGGVLVGLGAMVKMSPALLVAWWLLHRRWRAVAAAVATAVGSSLLVLPLVGPEAQVGFYLDVLPGFGRGEYNGLTVPITLPANHSIPSLVNELVGGPARVLSPAARSISGVLSLLVLGGLAWRFRRRPPDALASLCQVGAVVVAMLVLPVYTYEHHMVWMVVPYVAAALAVGEGRLARGWGVALLVAYGIQALPLDWLKAVYGALDALGPARDPVYYVLREAKFAAALGAGVACLLAGTRGAVTPPVEGASGSTGSSR